MSELQRNACARGNKVYLRVVPMVSMNSTELIEVLLTWIWKRSMR